MDALLAAVGPRTRLLFLANPNNPTGAMLPAAEVARLRAGLPAEVLLVLDAAYAEYVTRPDYDPGTALVDAGTNTVMTRTFSKIFGMGGARLGWAYAPAPIADILNRVRGPFNVNAPAMAAGIAALAEPGWMEKSVAHNTEWRGKLTDALRCSRHHRPPERRQFHPGRFRHARPRQGRGCRTPRARPDRPRHGRLQPAALPPHHDRHRGGMRHGGGGARGVHARG